MGVPLYSYNTSNELTSNSTGSYTYDNNGSTLTDPSGKSYTWDFENRMTQVVVPGTGTVTFKYDPFGRRIQKSSPSGTTNYLYDGMDIGANIIEEVDSGGNALARYTHGWAVDEPLASMRGPTTSYYQQDGLGSVSSLSSSSATLANTYTYDSFGKLTASAGTLTNPFEYTGREYDKEMNLYFYRARYYDPSVGRFVSEDPLRLKGGIDFYTYVKNRPIMAKDPTGLVLYLCSRPAFWSTRGYGTTGANHSFFLNPETGDNCGMGNGPRSENLQNPNIICTEIPGTDNAQRDAMDCCHQRAASSDWSMAHWKPYFHDCHSLTGDCLSQSGLASPGTPGGRVGCPTCDRGWHHD